MKKFTTLLAVIIVIAMFGSFMVGCKKDEGTKTDNTDVSKDDDVKKDDTKKDDTSTDAKKEDTPAPKEIKQFTMFAAVPGTEVPDNNRVMNKITEKIGAWAKVSYLTGQTADERVGVMIAGGDFPDFIDGSTGTPALIDAGALIPIDQYWDNYPNIKNYLSEADWNKVKKADGHIYYIPQFGIVQGKEMNTSHNGMAFWIQKDVLIWANYPDIRTLDDYFNVISDYLAAHPTTEDGQETVGFSMSSEDWRYFGIENPPLFLLGYPNDGACYVDPDTVTALDYNTHPRAVEYYKKMNEVFNQGLVHPETYTMSYDQYISLLSTGRVLGTLDQMWNFGTAQEALTTQGKIGQTYVPMPITFDRGMKDKYHSPAELDVSNGLGITTSCKDIEGAMQFLNDLLSPEVMALRFWGEEGVDYMVDADGVFYKTPEQRANYDNQDWAIQNLANKVYSYFPQFAGMLADDINAVDPKNQPGEFYETLYDIDKQLLDGYGYKTLLDFLFTDHLNDPWYPMWSATNTWTNETDYGLAKAKIADLKHKYLPQAMMAPADQFDAIWAEYQEAYRTEVDIDAYLDELTAEARRRAGVE
jgi:putative aldouronate transport system substrate-binding protein